MKELDKLTRERVGQYQEQNQKVENKFVGTVWIKTGCKLWCYNPDNDGMKEQIITKKGIVDFSGNVVEAKKAQHNPKYIYFQAINEKNARRKLARYRKGEYNIAENFENKEFSDLPKYF